MDEWEEVADGLRVRRPKGRGFTRSLDGPAGPPMVVMVVSSGLFTKGWHFGVTILAGVLSAAFAYDQDEPSLVSIPVLVALVLLASLVDRHRLRVGRDSIEILGLTGVGLAIDAEDLDMLRPRTETSTSYADGNRYDSTRHWVEAVYLDGSCASVTACPNRRSADALCLLLRGELLLGQRAKRRNAPKPEPQRGYRN